MINQFILHRPNPFGGFNYVVYGLVSHFHMSASRLELKATNKREGKTERQRQQNEEINKLRVTHTTCSEMKSFCERG